MLPGPVMAFRLKAGIILSKYYLRATVRRLIPLLPIVLTALMIFWVYLGVRSRPVPTPVVRIGGTVISTDKAGKTKPLPDVTLFVGASSARTDDTGTFALDFVAPNRSRVPVVLVRGSATQVVFVELTGVDDLHRTLSWK